MKLQDKVILVTGGSDGIGRHICLKLAAAGCQIAILGRDADRLAKVEAEVLAIGAPKAKGFACDMQDSAAVEATAAEVTREFGRIDILINNAGIWHKTGPLETIDSAMVEATVQTNLTGLMQLTRACRRSGRKTKPRSSTSSQNPALWPRPGSRFILPQNMAYAALRKC